MNATTTNPTANTKLARPERVEQRAVVAPPVDVFENDAELLLLADVPGATRDGIHVELNKGELSILARTTGEAPNAQGATLLASEFRPTDYQRVFRVPQSIDPEKIEADLSEGVLRIKLPKSEAHKSRRIAVKAG